MAVQPPKVCKDIFRNEWSPRRDCAEGGEMPSEKNEGNTCTVRAPVGSASTVRSSRSQSARTATSRISQGAASMASSSATRATIFTPKKSDDPIFSRQTPHPHCHNDRCCHLIEGQCGFRLLPAFQGTFGPPPEFSHRCVYPPIHSATMKPSAAPEPKFVTAAKQEISDFELQLNRQRQAATMDVMAAELTTQSKRKIEDALTQSSLGGTATAKLKVPSPPTALGSPNGNANGGTSRSNRHAWIINALREEGKLARDSSFLRGPSERARRESRGSVMTASQNAPSFVGPSGSLNPALRNNGVAESVPMTAIQRIDLASNYIVALLVKHTVPSIVMEYKRFVDRHRPSHYASGYGGFATHAVPSKISFVVHHQSGLTLPQFALFLEETVMSEMGGSIDDAPLSEQRLSAAFYALVDPFTKRFPTADFFGTFALSVVPPAGQVHTEHFISLFDRDELGFVPRTIFHHTFVRKYRERSVDAGMKPLWLSLERILQKLLSERHPVFVYLLNEVISAPMTPLARSHLTVESGTADDPAGVFSSHGDSRPLAITVREALCVIYGVPELHDFFVHNSLNRCDYI